MSEPPAISYRVCAARPGAHVFEVTLTVAEPDPEGQRLALPAWIPGSYLIRDFARHVLGLEASCREGGVAVSRHDKSTWRCAPCSAPLEVRYEVYAFDLSVRGAYLDTTRGYFNGPCVLLEVLGQGHRRCTLQIERPPGAFAADWRVATSMTALDTDAAGFGDYASADYEELIDHPFELSDHARRAFEAGGVAHTLALTGGGDCDLERLTDDLARICSEHQALFGAPVPIDRYLFLVLALGEGYGGLEHRWSNSVIIPRDHLPLRGREQVERRYRRFLGVLSHEYFHLWQVKRIRPAAFVPRDLSREQHTRLLWVFEGVTSYYDDLALVRSGVIEPAAYLELIADTVTGVQQTPGRHRQSIAESSFDAWTKLYKRDENAPNAMVSYYTKGSLVALALDLQIRRDTRGACSLDAVMRTLWQRYGVTGEGVPERGFEALVVELTGLAVDDFFDAYVYGTQDPPLEALLAAFGVELTFSAQKPSTPHEISGQFYLSALGIKINAEGKIDHVLDGTPAQAIGLSAGDRLVAADRLATSPAKLAAVLDKRAAGDVVVLHVFRRDELLRFELTIAAPPADVCRLALVEDADTASLERRRMWLTSGTGST